MKVYVAHRTDVDPSRRWASGSFTKLKVRMKKKRGATFTVVLHEFKPNLDNICAAIVDVTDLDAEWARDYQVTEAGHVREIKEEKP